MLSGFSFAAGPTQCLQSASPAQHSAGKTVSIYCIHVLQIRIEMMQLCDAFCCQCEFENTTFETKRAKNELRHSVVQCAHSHIDREKRMHLSLDQIPHNTRGDMSDLSSLRSTGSGGSARQFHRGPAADPERALLFLYVFIPTVLAT